MEPETVKHETNNNGHVEDKPITAQTLPGHDEEARHDNEGRHVFDPDAPDSPLRAEAAQVERLVLLEERMDGHAQILALVTIGLVVIAGLLALQVVRARAQ